MRIPYITGRWVRGREHYGRQRLIDYIVDGDEPAIWVVGTRRMGKTSLLRQLELETAAAGGELVPLFWDMQGCETFDDLSYELIMAVEDVAERFAPLGVDPDQLIGRDAVAILRHLNRSVAAQDRRLFVLIDEAEVLIDIGRCEPKWLARLRKAFQDGRQRTVIASTKLLAQLNEISTEWNTSPFLFGFSLANLWSLSPEAASNLVRNQRGDQPVIVDERVLDDILVHTHRHPYLMQYLCQRLFVAEGATCGSLRAVSEHDLNADHLLAGFFRIDVQHLTQLERRILLTIARRTIASTDDVIAELCDESPERIRTFVYGLEKLGYLRQLYGQLAVGNEFLRRWLQDNLDQLDRAQLSPLDEQSMESMLDVGKQNEMTYLHAEIARLQQTLQNLQTQPATVEPRGGLPPAHDLPRLHRELRAAQRALANIPQQDVAAVSPAQPQLGAAVPT